MALGCVSVLVPSAARAQDATALVVLGGPPLLLAPILAAVVRRTWLCAPESYACRGPRFLALSLLEFATWLATGWLAALVWFQDARLALLLLGGALAAIVVLNRRLLGASGFWPSPVASAAVFPAVWLVLQLVSYALLVASG